MHKTLLTHRHLVSFCRTKVNSAYQDQTPQKAASDQGLQSLVTKRSNKI